MDDVHWQLPNFQPFKAESEATAARIQAQEPQQQPAATAQAAQPPTANPTITFTVKPKK